MKKSCGGATCPATKANARSKNRNKRDEDLGMTFAPIATSTPKKSDDRDHESEIESFDDEEEEQPESRGSPGRTAGVAVKKSGGNFFDPLATSTPKSEERSRKVAHKGSSTFDFDSSSEQGGDTSTVSEGDLLGRSKRSAAGQGTSTINEGDLLGTSGRGPGTETSTISERDLIGTPRRSPGGLSVPIDEIYRSPTARTGTPGLSFNESEVSDNEPRPYEKKTKRKLSFSDRSEMDYRPQSPTSPHMTLPGQPIMDASSRLNESHLQSFYSQSFRKCPGTSPNIFEGFPSMSFAASSPSYWIPASPAKVPKRQVHISDTEERMYLGEPSSFAAPEVTLPPEEISMNFGRTPGRSYTSPAMSQRSPTGYANQYPSFKSGAVVSGAIPSPEYESYQNQDPDFSRSRQSGRPNAIQYPSQAHQQSFPRQNGFNRSRADPFRVPIDVSFGPDLNSTGYNRSRADPFRVPIEVSFGPNLNLTASPHLESSRMGYSTAGIPRTAPVPAMSPTRFNQSSPGVSDFASCPPPRTPTSPKYQSRIPDWSSRSRSPQEAANLTRLPLMRQSTPVRPIAQKQISTPQSTRAYTVESPTFSPVVRRGQEKHMVYLPQYGEESLESRDTSRTLPEFSPITRHYDAGRLLAFMDDTPENYPRADLPQGMDNTLTKRQWKTMEENFKKYGEKLSAQQAEEKAKFPSRRRSLEVKHELEKEEFSCYCKKQRYKMLFRLRHNLEESLKDMDLFGSILEEEGLQLDESLYPAVLRAIGKEENQGTPERNITCAGSCNSLRDFDVTSKGQNLGVEDQNLTNLGTEIEDYFNLYVVAVMTDSQIRFKHMREAIEKNMDWKEADENSQVDCHARRRLDRALAQLEANENEEKKMVCRRLIRRRLKLVADYLKSGKNMNATAASIRDDVKPRNPNITNEEAKAGYIGGEAAAVMIREEAEKDIQLQQDFSALLESRPDSKRLKKAQKQMKKEIKRRYEDFDEIWESLSTIDVGVCGLMENEDDEKPERPIILIIMGEIIHRILFRQFTLCDQVYDAYVPDPENSEAIKSSGIRETMDALNNYHINMARDFWMAMEWIRKSLKDKLMNDFGCKAACSSPIKTTDEKIIETYHMVDVVHKKHHEHVKGIFLQEEGAGQRNWREFREDYNFDIKEVMDAFEVMDFSREMPPLPDSTISQIESKLDKSMKRLQVNIDKHRTGQIISPRLDPDESADMVEVERIRQEMVALAKQERLKQRLQAFDDIDFTMSKCLPNCSQISHSFNLSSESMPSGMHTPPKTHTPHHSSIVNVDELEQIELAEQEELERSLSQWQSARRNVLSSMDKVKTKGKCAINKLKR